MPVLETVECSFSWSLTVFFRVRPVTVRTGPVSHSTRGHHHEQRLSGSVCPCGRHRRVLETHVGISTSHVVGVAEAVGTRARWNPMR